MTYPILPYPSPNYEARPKGTDISAIVLHTGEGTRASDLSTLTSTKPSPNKRVSSHYYVCRDTTIYQLVDDKYRAYHAGPGIYLGLDDWNDFSIGIETEHKQGQDWPKVQKDALAYLCQTLIVRHGIGQSMIIAHRWLKRPPTATKKYDPTNWPDPDLSSWIAALYSEPDWSALWGSQIPYHPDFGIPVAWRGSYRQGRPMGKAVSDEIQAKGRIVQVFENGYIAYAAGKVSVVPW